ncbi:hypothetical protein CCH79_00016780 [Gambusia affinis]|uniref:Endothelin-like toxin domain-containing protein n=1 Tax=Gambusia affinis TaxID=33528 RepID=A0A315VNV6_GAMAF|nr:hypothetical protein CCH79_00016780 [Gambusia affinis]
MYRITLSNLWYLPGCGLPLSDQQEALVSEPPPRHIRTKRCSCSNWEDRECIYFCHLDIIWVNTPSKLLPYGLGSSTSRRRRSASRCECRDPADKTCRGFCHKSPEDGRTEVLQKVSGTNNRRLLTALRSVVKLNTAIAKDIQSSLSSGAKKTKTRSGGPETLSDSSKLFLTPELKGIPHHVEAGVET